MVYNNATLTLVIYLTLPSS